jgi:hypothetical protein
MYRVWHVDKHKITFKLTNDKFQKSLSRPSITDARAHYWAAARRLRSIGLEYAHPGRYAKIRSDWGAGIPETKLNRLSNKSEPH